MLQAIKTYLVSSIKDCQVISAFYFRWWWTPTLRAISSTLVFLWRPRYVLTVCLMQWETKKNKLCEYRWFLRQININISHLRFVLTTLRSLLLIENLCNVEKLRIVLVWNELFHIYIVIIVRPTRINYSFASKYPIFNTVLLFGKNLLVN